MDRKACIKNNFPWCGHVTLFLKCDLIMPGDLGETQGRNMTSNPSPPQLIFYVSPARFGLKAAMPKQFYCSASCLKGVNGGSIDCNSASFAATTSLNDSGGYGPGCSLMWDRTGAVFRKMGKVNLCHLVVAFHVESRTRLPRLCTCCHVST
jgi:hypothetical protein